MIGISKEFTKDDLELIITSISTTKAKILSDIHIELHLISCDEIHDGKSRLLDKLDELQKKVMVKQIELENEDLK